MRFNVQKNNISPMVEAGILSSIAVLFAVIMLYIPVLGIFLNMLWPVPLILLGVRHGLKWSVMALVTSGLLIAIIVSPLQSLLQVVGLGFIGLTLGYCLYKKKKPTTSILYGSLASLVSKILVLLISFFIMGANPLSIDPQVMQVVADKVIGWLARLGMPDFVLEQYKSVIWMMLDLMVIIIPTGILMASVFDTFINFVATRAILKRLGTTIPGIPAFKNWTFPDVLLLLFGLSLLLLQYTQDNKESILYTIAVNGYFFLSVPLMFQGIAVSWFIIEEKGWPGFLKGILVGSLFITVIVPYMIIILGMFDYIMDFRKIRPARK